MIVTRLFQKFKIETLIFFLIFAFKLPLFSEEQSSTIFFKQAMAAYEVAEYENAINLFEHDIEELKIDSEKNEAFIATTYKFIGNCFYSIGNFEKDVEYQNKSLLIRLKLYGENCLDVGNNYSNLGTAYYYLQNYSEALINYEKALTLFRKYRTEDDPLFIYCLNQLGHSYYAVQKYEESINTYKESLKLSKLKYGEESVEACYLYLWIGNCYLNKENYEDAINWYTINYELSAKIYGEVNEQNALTAINIGRSYLAFGDYINSIYWITKCLNIDEKLHGENYEKTMQSCLLLSTLYLGLHDNINSEFYFNRAVEIQKNLINQGSLLENYIKPFDMAVFYESIGNYSEAINYFYEAITEGNDSEVILNCNIINCYEKMGDYTKALELGKKCLVTYSDNVESLLSIYDQMLSTYKAIEDYSSALLCCEEIYKLRTKLNESVYKAYYNYADINYKVNDFENAEIYIEKCINEIKELNLENTVEILLPYYLYNDILIKENRFEECLVNLDKMEGLLGLQSYIYKRVITNQKINFYIQLKNYVEAEKFLLEELKSEESLGDVILYLLYFQVAYFYYEKLNDYDKFSYYINKGFENSKKSNEYNNLISCSWSGIIEESNKENIDKSIIEKYLEMGIDSVERARLAMPEKKSQILAKAIPLYYAGVDISAKNGEYDKAFEYSELLRSRGFLDELGADAALNLDEITEEERNVIKDYASKISMYSKQLGNENQKTLEERSEEKINQIKGSLDFATRELNALEKEIGQRVPKYTQLRNPAVASAEEAKKWCGKNRAVLEYVMWNDSFAESMKEKGIAFDSENSIQTSLESKSKGEQGIDIKSYCLVITENNINAVELDSDFKYNETIEKLRKAVTSGQALNKGSVLYPRSSLYEKLVKPVEEFLPSNTKDIVIIPDGNLASVPFEILGDGENKDFGDKYNLSFSPSVSVSMMKSKKSSKNNLFLAIGNAVYNTENIGVNRGAETRGLETSQQSQYDEKKSYEVLSAGEYYAQRGFKWNNLPGTGEEIKSIQKKVFGKSAKLYESSDSTEKLIKKLSSEGELSKYSVFHLACHGYYNETDSEYSSVVLSEVSGTIKDSEEDGYLTIEELALLNLNSDFMNLSACQTGLSKNKRGDGMIGLTRACIVAGTDKVGATLWEVDDEATCQFMIKMYSKVKKGKTYQQAYHETKQEFKKSKGFSAPYFWAAFVLYE